LYVLTQNQKLQPEWQRASGTPPPFPSSLPWHPAGCQGAIAATNPGNLLFQRTILRVLLLGLGSIIPTHSECLGAVQRTILRVKSPKFWPVSLLQQSEHTLTTPAKLGSQVLTMMVFTSPAAVKSSFKYILTLQVYQLNFKTTFLRQAGGKCSEQDSQQPWHTPTTVHYAQIGLQRGFSHLVLAEPGCPVGCFHAQLEGRNAHICGR
jgi:hypothetical protein